MGQLIKEAREKLSNETNIFGKLNNGSLKTTAAISRPAFLASFCSK